MHKKVGKKNKYIACRNTVNNMFQLVVDMIILDNLSKENLQSMMSEFGHICYRSVEDHRAVLSIHRNKQHFKEQTTKNTVNNNYISTSG